jgi:pimeloyl-ACP methyl ester carboxylesterase
MSKYLQPSRMGTIASTNEDPAAHRPSMLEEAQAFEERRLRTQQDFSMRYDSKRISHFIPMLYMPYAQGSSKLLVYFHANAEEIVLSHDLLDFMRVLLKVNVVAVEYPGYGIYTAKHQKRYSYQQSVNPLLLGDLKNQAAGAARRRGRDVDGKIDLRVSSYEPGGFGFGCGAQSLKQQLENGSFNPYAPYNESVFESNEENILSDAEYVYDYLNLVLGIEQKNMLVFGRSMGSGAATHIASLRQPGSLLLMSGFKSIRSIAEDQAGRMLKYLVQERFNNHEKMSRVTCPTFIVHGRKDNLIPYAHSQALHDSCSGPCSLVLPPDMDHNDFDYCDSLITPFYHFLMQMSISTTQPQYMHSQTIIPEDHLIIPKAYIPQPATASPWSCYCVPSKIQESQNLATRGSVHSAFNFHPAEKPTSQ